MTVNPFLVLAVFLVDVSFMIDVKYLKDYILYMIYIYINVTFQMFFLGFNKVTLTSDGHAQDGILNLKLLNESRGFSLLALERSKACSRARVGGESGGVDDCPRDLVERGRHQHWRGRVRR